MHPAPSGTTPHHAPLRILQVIHQYPPFSSQGSEIHCQLLSHALAKGGDTVGVFHVSKTSSRDRQRMVTGMDGPVSTFHCRDGGEFSRLADWPNPALQRCFREVLREFRPDVVHFHNFVSLGDDLVGMARQAGAAVVYTLHDFGLICPNSLLLRTDGALCGKADPGFFEACCPALPRSAGGRTPFLASRLPALPRWRQFAANMRHPIAGPLVRTAIRGATALLGEPATTDVAAKRTFYLGATRRIFAQVDRFIAPSASQRQRYVACGVAPERIVHLRNGMRHFPRGQAGAPPDRRLRFGYIGAFHAHKGIDLLLEAFRGLGDRASLHLHGSSFGSPVSEAHFRQATAGPPPGVEVHGRYDNERIGEILAGLDAVIVPSRWYEVAPLTIQEAQIAGVPVITAGVGGMAELVRDGVDGLHFACGDAQALRQVLIRLIDHPEQLAALRANAPAVPTVEEQTRLVRDQYGHAHAARNQPVPTGRGDQPARA